MSGTPTSKRPPGLEDAAGLREEMGHFFVKFEVLEHVLAVNVANARVGKGPLLAQIELEIGARVEIDRC